MSLLIVFITITADGHKLGVTIGCISSLPTYSILSAREEPTYIGCTGGTNSRILATREQTTYIGCTGAFNHHILAAFYICTFEETVSARDFVIMVNKSLVSMVMQQGSPIKRSKILKGKSYNNPLYNNNNMKTQELQSVIIHTR